MGILTGGLLIVCLSLGRKKKIEIGFCFFLTIGFMEQALLMPLGKEPSVWVSLRFHRARPLSEVPFVFALGPVIPQLSLPCASQVALHNGPGTVGL